MVRKSTTSFKFGIDAPDLASAFQKDIIEALIPKETRKQAQKQLALEVLSRVAPLVSEFAPQEKEKFYNQYFFPAYGMYQPPTFRRLFGAKPEPILPLPKGAEEIPSGLEGAKILTPMGRRRELKAGLTLPEQEPMKFTAPPLLRPEHERELEKQAVSLYPESPEEQAKWLRGQKTAILTKTKPLSELEKLYKEALTEDVRARSEGRKIAPSWSPKTKEEYLEVHKPKGEDLKTFEEKERIKAKYRPGESPAEKKAEKEKDKKISALRDEIKLTETKIDRAYSRYLDILKRQMTAHNKSGEEPIEDLTELPTYMSLSDWLIEHPEGKLFAQSLDKMRDDLHYLQTGETRPWETRTPTRMRPLSLEEILPQPKLGEPVPFKPTAVTPPPQTRAPSVIRYDAQGKRVQ